jgi:hypothetical protein
MPWFNNCDSITCYRIARNALADVFGSAADEDSWAAELNSIAPHAAKNGTYWDALVRDTALATDKLAGNPSNAAEAYEILSQAIGRALIARDEKPGGETPSWAAERPAIRPEDADLVSDWTDAIIATLRK